MNVDHKRRAEEMHRRAQLAEGKMERAMWWIDAGLKRYRPLSDPDRPWLTNRFYLEEAKRAAEREPRPHHPGAGETCDKWEAKVK